MPPPPILADLVERFDEHRDQYRSGKRLLEAKTSHDKEVLKRQIDATDRQIDRFVYELYELTDEEIGIVEEATK